MVKYIVLLIAVMVKGQLQKINIKKMVLKWQLRMYLEEFELTDIIARLVTKLEAIIKL